MIENFKNQGYGDLFKNTLYSNQAKKEITPFSSNTNNITPKLFKNQYPKAGDMSGNSFKLPDVSDSTDTYSAPKVNNSVNTFEVGSVSPLKHQNTFGVNSVFSSPTTSSLKPANTFKPNTAFKTDYDAGYLIDYASSGGSVFDTDTTGNETYEEDYGTQYLRKWLNTQENVAPHNDLTDFTKTVQQNPADRVLIADAGNVKFGPDLPKPIKNPGTFDYDSTLSQSSQYNLSVAVLQNELKWLGYYFGDVDGLFGPQTVDAVNKYKEDNAIPNMGMLRGVVDLWTWKSLGLTYRSKEDVAAGITIVTDGLKQRKDVSVPLRKALEKVSKTAKALNVLTTVYGGGIVAKGAWFLNQVYHEQPWDIKVVERWNETIAKGTFPGEGVEVYYNGWLATPEELGNYTYGYIGNALGFSLPTLYGGSWMAAGIPFGGENLENEFDDWPAIKRGFEAYDKGM